MDSQSQQSLARLVQNERIASLGTLFHGADVMKTWPCADFSFIRDLLRILAWHKPVFAGIEPILRASLGTSPRRL